MTGQIIAGPMPCAGCGTIVVYGRVRPDIRDSFGNFRTHGHYPVLPTITAKDGQPHVCTEPEPAARQHDLAHGITTRRETHA